MIQPKGRCYYCNFDRNGLPAGPADRSRSKPLELLALRRRMFSLVSTPSGRLMYSCIGSVFAPLRSTFYECREYSRQQHILWSPSSKRSGMNGRSISGWRIDGRVGWSARLSSRPTSATSTCRTLRARGAGVGGTRASSACRSGKIIWARPHASWKSSSTRRTRRRPMLHSSGPGGQGAESRRAFYKAETPSQVQSASGLPVGSLQIQNAAESQAFSERAAYGRRHRPLDRVAAATSECAEKRTVIWTEWRASTGKGSQGDPALDGRTNPAGHLV